MAEYLLKHALNAESSPLNELKIASFGTNAFTGSPASQNAIAAMARVAIDLKPHNSRAFDDVDHSDVLYYLCMTEAHRDALVSFFEVDPDKVYLVREWLEQPTSDIPDPFGQNIKAYIHCRDSIVEAIPSIVSRLKSFLG